MSKRTLEDYKQLGASLRLAKEFVHKMMSDDSVRSKRTVYNKLDTVYCKLQKIGWDLENIMLHDFPDLDNEYCHVFNGSLTGDPRGAMDKDIYEIAENIASNLVTMS